MTKTANKFNSLAQIAFVEDINQETAANYSGGAKVTVYQGANFNGSSAIIDDDNISYVGDAWNDQVSSIKIEQGVWEFFSEANYKGDTVVVGPGSYNVIDPYLNDRISSVKRVA
jgi:Beta/Gamma crystallin